jgi:hypothetical protein
VAAGSELIMKRECAFALILYASGCGQVEDASPPPAAAADGRTSCQDGTSHPTPAYRLHVRHGQWMKGKVKVRAGDKVMSFAMAEHSISESHDLGFNPLCTQASITVEAENRGEVYSLYPLEKDEDPSTVEVTVEDFPPTEATKRLKYDQPAPVHDVWFHVLYNRRTPMPSAAIRPTLYAVGQFGLRPTERSSTHAAWNVTESDQPAGYFVVRAADVLISPKEVTIKELTVTLNDEALNRGYRIARVSDDTVVRVDIASRPTFATLYLPNP